MSLVSVTKISSLMLDSVAEQVSLSLTWSKTPKDMFSHDKAQIYLAVIGWLVVLRLNVPVNNFSVMSGRSHRFLGN